LQSGELGGQTSVSHTSFFDVCQIHNLFYVLSGSKPGDYYSSHTLLLVYLTQMTLNPFVYYTTDSWLGWGMEKLAEKQQINASITLRKCSGNIAATHYIALIQLALLCS
jgi:hypothetical protein